MSKDTSDTTGAADSKDIEAKVEGWVVRDFCICIKICTLCEFHFRKREIFMKQSVGQCKQINF